MKYLGDNQDEKSIVSKNILPLMYGSGVNSTQGANGVASGENSFAFEHGIASGNYSFAFGTGSQAIGTGSVAFMRGIARGMGAFALGGQNGEQRQPEATGTLSIAIGASTYASGNASVAIGLQTTASAAASIALGNRTIAGSANQTVIGKRNIEDTNNIYAFIIGNGTADNARSNAFTVDWEGNVIATSFTGIVSGYLPLTGGILNGDLTINGNSLCISQNDQGEGAILFTYIGTENSNTLGTFYETKAYNNNNGRQTKYIDRAGMMLFKVPMINNGVLKPSKFSWYYRSFDSSLNKANYYEIYSLPEATVGLSANTSYDILTSKTSVTVEQGGTGATTAAEARTNLGLGTMATQSSSSYLPLTGGKITGAFTLQSSFYIKGGGTNSDNIYFGSYAKEGTTYTTTEQNSWGRIQFTIPALKTSDSTYYSERFTFQQYSHNNGVKADYYEQYRLPICEINLSQSKSYDILTTKNPVTIAQGGTGLSSSPSLLVNLSSTTAANILTSSPRPGITGTLSIANGGTGATTSANARANLGISSVTSFAGTLGVDGTITNLPAAASSNQGDTYKVITTGTYANQNAKIGDLFTSNGSSWVYTPFLGDRFNNAGINDRTYIIEVPETTVTTEYTDVRPSYYAYVAERDGNLKRGSYYKMTFDGVEYYGPMMRWFQSGVDTEGLNGQVNEWWSKGVTFFGNLSLFCDASGFYDPEYYNNYIDPTKDFPFLITNMYTLFPYINPEKIFLYTKTAGQHTIKIERIDYDMALIPNSLNYGNEIKPIYERIGTNSVYTGICVGLNDMQNRKSTIAVGWNNIMNAQAGIIVGNDNVVNAMCGIAIGNRNEANAAGASAFGYATKASGSYAESHGYDSIASGMLSTTHGFRTISNHKSQFTFGEYNIADSSSATASNRGNYIEIVGNGTNADNRSNARTLDWSGNEALAGSITLGKGTADEVTLTATQLKQLKQLINA